MKERIKTQSVIPRLDGIMRDMDKLKKLANKSLSEFKRDETSFPLAQFYLRQALEGVFHIGEHILSRLKGGRATEYKEIARKLGEFKIVDRNYADTTLVKMAGYRNRLTHFYAEVKEDEIHRIIKENLDDFNPFIRAVKDLLQNPQIFGLEVE